MASPQVEALYHEVRRRIINGIYRPGARLKEEHLAQEHGTSRTPVRETLSRLRAEGLVERVPNQGYSVAALTVADLGETFDVRLLLEGETAARAARYASTEQLAVIRGLAPYDFEIGDADSYEEALERNHEFHLAVAEAAANHLLLTLVRICLTRMNRFWALGYGMRLLPEHPPELSERPMVEGNAEHLALVAALEAHDPDAARRIMESHVTRNRELMIGRLLSEARRGTAVSLHLR